MASQPPTQPPASGSDNVNNNNNSTTPETPAPLPTYPDNGTPAPLHMGAIGVAVLGPIAYLLPGRGKARGGFSLQNMMIGSGTFWAFNQLTHDYTGKSIYQRSNERWAKVFNAMTPSGLPEKAAENKRRMAEERARREAGLPERERQLLEEQRRLKEEKNRGVIKGLWMGKEEEGWQEKRLAEEKKALDEGKGYADLIIDQIWEVWNQTTGGKKAGEGEKEEKKDGEKKN